MTNNLLKHFNILKTFKNFFICKATLRNKQNFM